MTTQNRIATDLKNLLSKWKLECILSHLLAEKIDTDIFQMMKLTHIRLLLHNFPLGIQIRFEYNLEQWRKDIGNPFQTATIEDRFSSITSTVHDFKADLVKTNLQDKEIQTDLIIYNVNSIAQTNNEHNVDAENAACSGASAEDPLSKIGFDLPSEQITTGMSNIFKTPLQTPPVDLRTILSHSPRGISLIKNYRFRKRFSNAERNLLISDIVNYYLENNIEFNVQISYALERAILKMFHSEKLSFYRTTKRGGLYTKYIRAKAAMKQESVNYNGSGNNMDYSALDKEENELTDHYSVDSQIMEEVFHAETPVISDVSHFENEDNETIVSDNNISMEGDYIKLEPEIMWSEQANPPQNTMVNSKCAGCQEVSKRLDAVLEILDEHKVLLDSVVSQNVIVENIISIFPINTEEKLKEFDGLLALQSEPYIQQIKNLIRGNVERNLNQIFGKNIIMNFNVDGTFGKKGLRDFSNVLTAIIDVISTFNDSPDKTLRAAFQRQKKKYFKENSRNNSKVKATNDENVQEP